MAQTTTVMNAGFTFTPADITISVGDTIVWDIAAQHNVIQVSMANYTANDNTPLSGGFSVPFSGGMVTGLSIGTYYYVCSPHASQQMKGTVTVVADTSVGINSIVRNHSIELFPNPTSNKLFLRGLEDLNITQFEIVNVIGQVLVFEQLNSNEIDIDVLNEGSYFLHLISAEGSRFAMQFVKTNN